MTHSPSWFACSFGHKFVESSHENETMHLWNYDTLYSAIRTFYGCRHTCLSTKIVCLDSNYFNCLGCGLGLFFSLRSVYDTNLEKLVWYCLWSLSVLYGVYYKGDFTLTLGIFYINHGWLSALILLLLQLKVRLMMEIDEFDNFCCLTGDISFFPHELFFE